MKIPSLSKLSRRLLPLVAALALAGCASVSQSLPELPAAPAFKEQGAPPQAGWTQALPAEAQARGQWWLAFADPALNALVDKATLDNQSIQAAAARLAEARALARSANAERLPQLGLGAGATRGAGLDKASGTRPATLVNAGLNLSYEVDLFGRISQAADASRLDAEGREALLQHAAGRAGRGRTDLSATARAGRRARPDARDRGGLPRHAAPVGRRLQAGDIAELDVARIQAELSATESDALALDRQRAQVEHALAVLVGDSASRFGLGEGAWTTALPSIPAGVPATVLMRRPDISAAQRAVFAAQSRVGVAKTAWFPSISLTGAAGHASPEVGDLFKWSMRSWGVGALLSLPLFDGGRREPVCRPQARSSMPRWPPTASRRWWPSRRWRTSCRPSASCRSSPPCRARRWWPPSVPPACRTRATAMATSASWTCWMRAAANCATAARRCR